LGGTRECPKKNKPQIYMAQSGNEKKIGAWSGDNKGRGATKKEGRGEQLDVRKNQEDKP